MSSDVKHDYHLVDPSPWPIVGSVFAFTLELPLGPAGMAAAPSSPAAPATSFALTVMLAEDNGVNQRLIVPFAAVTAFADPHAKFGLQFHVEFEERTAADEELDMDDDAGDPSPHNERAAPAEDTVPLDSAKVTRQVKNRKPQLRTVTSEGDDAPEGASKVVTLDAFRKK